jgi:uncharacterized coiled-coil protein SlyX
LKNKILAMEKADKEKDDLIKDLEIKMRMQEKKIEDINNMLITLTEKETSLLELGKRGNSLEEKLDDNFRELENKMSKEIENTDVENVHDELIKSMDRRIYVLEKRRLGTDFCDYCDFEFKLGSEKERKEKDIHIRNNHTFQCNVCEIKLGNKEELDIHFLTCEMYICSLCNYTHKRLSELKNHCKTKHTRNTIIRHSKMDRDNFSKLSFTNYFSEEI